MSRHEPEQSLGFPILVCLIALMSACRPSPTVSVEETVQARLTEEAARQEAVAGAVEQTLTAQPSATPIPPTPTRLPPTPTRLPPTPTRIPLTLTPYPIILTRIFTTPPPGLPELELAPEADLLTTPRRTPARLRATPRATGIARPTPRPVTHSTGPLEIPQTWTADLDEGVVGAGADADIWFEAVTATERYVSPRNGATIAVVGRSSVGRSGCAAASLSTARIHVKGLPEGTYVCVRTNLGRYSQFRVNAPIGPSPGTLEIGYTTWE